MRKLSLIALCMVSIATSSCSKIFQRSGLPGDLVLASDICASQKHNECHHEYDSYEDSYQPPLPLAPEDPVKKIQTEPDKNINNIQKIKIKDTQPKKTTIKERYKISVEINDISTERAIDQIKNANKYSFGDKKSQDQNTNNNVKDIKNEHDNDEIIIKNNIQKSEILPTEAKPQVVTNLTQNNKNSQIQQTINEESKTVNKKIEKSKLNSDFFLEEVRYPDLPKFNIQGIKPAFDEFLKSCKQYLKDDSKWIKSKHIAIEKNHMLEICKDGEKVKSEIYKYQTDEQNKALEGFFVRWFSPYKVFSRGKDYGTFTGYYETHIKGSTKATCEYLYPIYALPDNPEHQRFTREEINNGALRGRAKILFWAKNPVDIYLTQIQGSGVIETEDKKQYRIGYAGNNGYSFTGTGDTIKKMGLRPEKGLSMMAIRDFLNNNPETAKKVMNANKRFIFFKENKQSGAIGTFGTTLTAKQTIAVDQAYIPLGIPLFIDVKDPNNKPLNRIVIASDTGAAIKGGVRADFFFGFGEEALKQAGRMKQTGKYFILLPKNQDKFMVKSDNIHCLD